MKMVVNVKEISYGCVTVEVSENASKDEIKLAAIDAIHQGNANWGRSEVELDD